MHIYRSHTCGVLRKKDQGKTVRLSGWVFRKRDHGGLVFIDLRDYSGLIQLIGSPAMFSSISLESVICVTGIVRARSLETINKDLLTGEVEIHVDVVNVLSHASSLPISIHDDSSSPEDMRLQYRYLDLRRPDMYNRMILRTKIIDYLRNAMRKKGFVELQTPILTASSPEGARDFLVPSRLHVGKFYALPQAPQIFKQLLMVAGFDRYFQIAPCFRDEDSRADRSPGEFYQLDIEMSFVTQDDVFSTVEPVLYEIFSIFSSKKVTPYPFPRITYHEAMTIYGSDKPDLRNPLRIVDVTNVFSNSSFRLFASLIEQGAVVRAIRVKNLALQPRKMFHDLTEWALDNGQSGLGYIMLKDNLYAGPLSKHLDENRIMQLVDCLDLHETDGAFFICGLEQHIEKFSGLLRTKLAEYLELINDDSFHFLWVVDFPMYTRDVNTGVINFFHNPFSMPQGGMDSLLQKDPLDILAYQYDIVCNGVELSSGAIRNHLPEIMYKAFEIAGYSNQYVNQTFSSMIKAFQFGAPPHGGCAPGIDRMIMLLLGAKNLREVILFPMNQMGEDLMMRAPSTVSELQLRELGLKYL